jgi:ribosomal-protein-alanine N-acetyltransferase
MPLPVLHTPRLILQPYRLDDVDALHELWTEPDVRRFLWDDTVISRERAEETVRDSLVTAEQYGFGQWLLIERASNSVTGFCGCLKRGENEDPELLYGLGRRWWGRGLATEAVARVLWFMFDVYGCPRVTAATDPPNAASIRLMRRIGMRFVRRGRLNSLDTIFYEVYRSDFANGPIGQAARPYSCGNART